MPLDSGEPTYLLEREPDWITWRPTYSPNREHAVYWVKKEAVSELWVTSLRPWAPERLLWLPETDYVAVAYEWLNPNRHLLVQFYEPDETIDVLEVVAASYIVDIVEKTIISPDGWQGFCAILAVSPRTNRLSSWCPIQDEASGQLTYMIVGQGMVTMSLIPFLGL